MESLKYKNKQRYNEEEKLVDRVKKQELMESRKKRFLIEEKKIKEREENYLEKPFFRISNQTIDKSS